MPGFIGLIGHLSVLCFATLCSMSHKRDIEHYEGHLDELAQDIGRLTYDQLATFLGYLARELSDQSEADKGRGRPRLSREIGEASGFISMAIPHVDAAWQLSSPHMTAEERGEV